MWLWISSSSFWTIWNLQSSTHCLMPLLNLTNTLIFLSLEIACSSMLEVLVASFVCVCVIIGRLSWTRRRQGRRRHRRSEASWIINFKMAYSILSILKWLTLFSQRGYYPDSLDSSWEFVLLRSNAFYERWMWEGESVWS